MSHKKVRLSSAKEKSVVTPSTLKDLESAESKILPTDYNLYYSSAVEGNLSNLLGAPHYSYRFAEAKFTSALQSHGVAIHKLLMPEFYNTSASLPTQLNALNKPNLHLIFRSTEEIRLLKFAWNVSCFAWEFDVLKDETDIDEHPFLNQKRMLSLCDEIWVPCSYTRSVLERYGIKNSYVIPAPINVSTTERMPIFDALSYLGHIFVAPLEHNFLRSPAQNRASCGEGSSILVDFISARLKSAIKTKIYLSILNPEDFRKNLDTMLRAFHYFSRGRNDLLLVVKVLTSKSRFPLLDVLSEVIPRKLDSGTSIKSENIVFFNDFLTESEMTYLYAIADFYLCTSYCEGQNLPLLEAMAHGVVPVTTAHTAMTDYITTDNAVIITDRPEMNDIEHLAGTISRRSFYIHRSRLNDVYEALQKSVQLTRTRYLEMSERARETVRNQYSVEIVLESIKSRLSAIYPNIRDSLKFRARSY